MKIIEKHDTCQYTGLHYQYEEIAYISRRRSIKNACPLAMQHKVFHLLGEKLLSASQSDGGKKEAGEQCQGIHIIRTGRVEDRDSLESGVQYIGYHMAANLRIEASHTGFV